MRDIQERLTVREVAQRLRTSSDTILRLIRAGKISAINSNASTKKPRWVITSEALEEFELRNSNARPVVPMVRRRVRREVVPNYYA